MSNCENKLKPSLLKYYQDYCFNPVPINVEDKNVWELHMVKRRNLYERHLKIPLSLFNGRSVIEFGCNSGENALHLAACGARLTLVEPNDQVLPRLKTLFKNFGFEQSIVALVNKDIAGFESQNFYDVVLAEGFLNALSNRDEMFLKICRFLVPNGLGVISFDDRYGSLLEVTKQLILKRACCLKKIDDIHSQISLELAKTLFGEDFARLNASRSFEVWWKDVLLNPFVAWKHLWTYQEFIPLLEKAGCEFYSSSPKWTRVDHFLWYKDVPNSEDRHQRLLSDWHRAFPSFLTGLPFFDEKIELAPFDVVEATSELIEKISEYVSSENLSIDSVSYPSELDNYLNKSEIAELQVFNDEMKRIFDVVKSSQFDELISNYHDTKYIRMFWGTPCHYICFIKR
ncbi:MAG: class I SAM-dependent methyltransferase [Candidatus Omnitrophota bacterium]|nr:MAG: class I SAM-dependent methyltransferase [Candidatus Omnitrophota bacterium]